MAPTEEEKQKHNIGKVHEGLKINGVQENTAIDHNGAGGAGQNSPLSGKPVHSLQGHGCSPQWDVSRA